MAQEKGLALKDRVHYPSEKLRDKIDEVVRHIHNCAMLVKEAFIMGVSEGFSEKEIGRLIRVQMTRLGYDPRTIRRVLPPSAKDISRTRKDYLNKDQNYEDSGTITDEDNLSGAHENASCKRGP